VRVYIIKQNPHKIRKSKTISEEEDLEGFFLEKSQSPAYDIDKVWNEFIKSIPLTFKIDFVTMS